MDLVQTYSSSTEKSSDYDSPVKTNNLSRQTNNKDTPSKNSPRLNLVEKILKKTNNPQPGCSVEISSDNLPDIADPIEVEEISFHNSPDNVDPNEAEEVNITNDCKCDSNCSLVFASDSVKNIRKSFGKFDVIQRRAFIREYVTRAPAKRRRTDNDDFVKTFSYQYSLLSDEGTKILVCQAFFLFCIGHKSSSSNVIYRAWPKLDETGGVVKDKRGRYVRNKDLQNAMLRHVKSFEPVESHYRREHAPLAKYLPSDLNQNKLFEDWKLYCQNNQLKVGSKTLYRKVLKKENIRFVQPKQEDCEDCQMFFQHETESTHSRHELNENTEIECDQCRFWFEHIQDAGRSRSLYNSFSQNPSQPDSLTIAVDLEKVNIDC